MSRSKDIYMSESRLAPDLRIGCIRLIKAHTLPLSNVYVVISANKISIAFGGDTPEPWEGTSFVTIFLFKLPRGKAEFQTVIERYSGKRKTRARLPDGIAFDESTLAIRNLPDGWQHAAFPRSGRDFIHVYQSKQYAVMIRLYGSEGTILDNPLLKRIHKNLSIVENQWIAEFPTTESRKRGRDKVTDTPLASDVENEIREAIARARDSLNLGRTRNPAKTVQAIHDSLEEIRSGKRMSAEDKKQRAIDYGALLGDALCAAANWEWCCVKPTAVQNVYAVSSKSRSHVVNPISVIHHILSSRKVANNSLLLFNMIVSGNLPESPERGYCWLT